MFKPASFFLALLASVTYGIKRREANPDDVVGAVAGNVVGAGAAGNVVGAVANGNARKPVGDDTTRPVGDDTTRPVGDASRVPPPGDASSRASTRLAPQPCTPDQVDQPCGATGLICKEKSDSAPAGTPPYVCIDPNATVDDSSFAFDDSNFSFDMCDVATQDVDCTASGDTGVCIEDATAGNYCEVSSMSVVEAAERRKGPKPCKAADDTETCGAVGTCMQSPKDATKFICGPKACSGAEDATTCGEGTCKESRKDATKFFCHKARGSSTQSQ